MSEPGSRRGRAHDAEGAREAILNAAEKVFAEHGFDGARIDAIAAEAGYNKSLIFQYFDDKLGLYAAVIRRADREMTSLQAEWLPALLENDIASNPHKLQTLLRTVIREFFDYLVEHPRLMRIFSWEMAEGWQTFAKIFSERDREDVEQFRPLLEKAQSAGLLRPGLDPVIVLTMTIYFCQFYLATLPMYQLLLPAEDVSSAPALARAREYMVDFIVHGAMIDPPETKP